jgi:hypothetical protein
MSFTTVTDYTAHEPPNTSAVGPPLFVVMGGYIRQQSDGGHVGQRGARLGKGGEDGGGV